MIDLRHGQKIRYAQRNIDYRVDGIMGQMEILFNDYKEYVPQTRKIFCYFTGDYIEQASQAQRNENILTFSYNKNNKQQNIYVVPDFIFYNWKEAGQDDFYDFYNNITQNKINQKQFDGKKDILFWSGNLDFYNQKQLLNSKYYSKVLIQTQNDSQLMDIYDHGQFKYLLDISGKSWSQRLKYLLLLKSVVFIVQRETVEWWDEQFIPYQHYMPVKADGSDLNEKLNMLKTNQDLAYQIAEQGYQQAVKVFAKDNVYKYYAKILNQYPSTEI